MEVRLNHLRRLSRIEPSSIITPSTSRTSLDCPRRERLRPALRHQRIRTTSNRIPHQRRQPRRQPERIQHRHRPHPRAPRQRQEQVIRLGQRHQRRTRRRQQRRRQNVQRLARALRPDHPSRPVERAPQLSPTRTRRPPDPPPHLSRPTPAHRFPLRAKSGRTTLRTRRSLPTPSNSRASSADAYPAPTPGPHRNHASRPARVTSTSSTRSATTIDTAKAPEPTEHAPGASPASGRPARIPPVERTNSSGHNQPEPVAQHAVDRPSCTPVPKVRASPPSTSAGNSHVSG
ncbi:Basic proline-rich protein precursor [Luteococcus japonicus LSP_Lj1]|uniref:Basic proline-rich protein n=1 Tax=Luteococcus japonicus LSP_Lj1 TaxID=1255658 RepID=A0A1R4IP60_9ACTN|nr:Basic proline-rich protein precursor [Luteococcus japonicus LSP_Lj1]